MVVQVHGSRWPHGLRAALRGLCCNAVSCMMLCAGKQPPQALVEVSAKVLCESAQPPLGVRTMQRCCVPCCRRHAWLRHHRYINAAEVWVRQALIAAEIACT